MKQLVKQSHTAQTYVLQEGDQTIVHERVDVSQNLDRVKRMREADINGAFGHCVASIPLSAVAQWGQQFGLTIEQVANDDALLDRCTADYSKFKVKGGVF